MNTFETNMRDAPSAASGDAPKNKVYYIADVEGTIASYNPNYILRKLPGEDPYKMALPSAAGTLALTSDIEAVSGEVYEEIDEIKDNYNELRTDTDEISGKVDALEDIVSGTDVAHLGGKETFTGEKTFSNPILVGDDEAGLSVTYAGLVKNVDGDSVSYDLPASGGTLATIESIFDKDGTIDGEKIRDSSISPEKLSTDVVESLTWASGDGTDSTVQRQTETDPIVSGSENNAVSQGSISEGASNFVGLHGYRYTNEVGDAITDTLTFETVPEGWAEGDVVSVVNDAKYPDAGTIQSISGNTVTFAANLDVGGIVKEDNGWDARCAYVSAKPDKGNVDMGYGSHAEGVGSKALNAASHAEGRETRALGQYSHAEGRETKAQYCSHAEGRDTEATGSYSHSEGASTKSIAEYSHAEGFKTEANFSCSHVE